MTSTSVGWVLLDGQGPDAAILDHDAFDVRAGADATASDTSQHVAAARGAQSIATASGHKVSAVQVTWTSDVEADGAALLKSLADLGFENVRALPLSRAVQAWGIEVGRVNEHQKTALCVLEPDTVTVMVVATGAGTVRTAVIDNCETTDDLVESLRTIFGRDGWLPESLHVVGSRSDLDEVTEPIRDALPIPVIEAARHPGGPCAWGGAGGGRKGRHRSRACGRDTSGPAMAGVGRETCGQLPRLPSRLSHHRSRGRRRVLAGRRGAAQ